MRQISTRVPHKPLLHLSRQPNRYGELVDSALFWTIFGAVSGGLALMAAVGFGIFAALGYFKAYPKRQLTWGYSMRPLITQPGVAKLEVSVDGVRIKDPYLIQLQIVSNSRADISSDDFDGQRPIRIHVKNDLGLLVATTESGISLSDERDDIWDAVILRIEPALIRPGDALSVDLVTNGVAIIEVEPYLKNIQVVQVPDRRAQLAFMTDLLSSGVVPFTSRFARLLEVAQRHSAR